MHHPKYKRGDLVRRSWVGFGIVYSVEHANMTDEEIIQAFPGDMFIYSILWDSQEHPLSGFREYDIDEMREQIRNAQSG
jgi:hypothetical protein